MKILITHEQAERRMGERTITLRAFTLIEVMVAVGIFFMAMFAILGVMSQALNAASILHKTTPTAAMAAAQMTLTNKLADGPQDGDFGDIYPGYKWTAEITQVCSNGMFKVEVAVTHEHIIDSVLTTYLFRPDSPNQGSFAH